MPRPAAPAIDTQRWDRGGWQEARDRLSAEEPLQLTLRGRPLGIVMRTPGNDLELGLGLLWSERILSRLEQVRRVRISAEADEREPGLPLQGDLVESNQLDFELAGAGRLPDRSFMRSSACGVCGATTVESLALDFPPLAAGPYVDPALLPALADSLRGGQRVFDQTGGLHAAGLFSESGELLVLREDVGRHNAVDKVVGRALLDGRLPASRCLLAVSGRGGYEIVQKAVAAGIPLVAAVGAPSSLAVATARRFGQTLVGFLRDGRFNVYSSPERLRPPG